MNMVDVLGPEQEEINDQWTEFFKNYRDRMPEQATALTLGSVFLLLMEDCGPPVDEIVPVVVAVLNTYVDMHSNHTGYLN